MGTSKESRCAKKLRGEKLQKIDKFEIYLFGRSDQAFALTQTS